MLNVRELTAIGNRWNLAKRPPNVVQNDGYRENDGYRVLAGYRVQHILYTGKKKKASEHFTHIYSFSHLSVCLISYLLSQPTQLQCERITQWRGQRFFKQHQKMLGIYNFIYIGQSADKVEVGIRILTRSISRLLADWVFDSSSFCSIIIRPRVPLPTQHGSRSSSSSKRQRTGLGCTNEKGLQNGFKG